MTICNYVFLYEGKETVLKNGDIVKVDIIEKTISFIRNNIPIFLKFGSDIIYNKDISSSNASKIIQNITGLTSILNTNDSEDILIYKLGIEIKTDEEIEK